MDDCEKIINTAVYNFCFFSERNGDEPSSPPANSTIGLQPDSGSLAFHISVTYVILP